MSLEIYAGPLTIYDEQEWRVRLGPPVTATVHAHSPAPEPIAQPSPLPADSDPDPDELIPIRVMRFHGDRSAEREKRRKEIASWRKRLGDEIGRKGLAPLDWDETREEFAGAYPGDRGLFLLRRHAADLVGTAPLSHFSSKIELWLPSNFDFTFEADDRQGRRTHFASIFGLLENLNHTIRRRGRRRKTQ